MDVTQTQRGGERDGTQDLRIRDVVPSYPILDISVEETEIICIDFSPFNVLGSGGSLYL